MSKDKTTKNISTTLLKLNVDRGGSEAQRSVSFTKVSRYFPLLAAHCLPFQYGNLTGQTVNARQDRISYFGQHHSPVHPA